VRISNRLTRYLSLSTDRWRRTGMGCQLAIRRADSHLLARIFARCRIKLQSHSYCPADECLLTEGKGDHRRSARRRCLPRAPSKVEGDWSAGPRGKALIRTSDPLILPRSRSSTACACCKMPWIHAQAARAAAGWTWTARGRRLRHR
jgi:hypothetical protein